MRLIDKDALLEKLGIAETCGVCTQNNEPYCRWKPDVVDVCEIINDAPTIEPERKKGIWRKVSADKYKASASYVYRCERCGEVSWRNSDFCPNCGADMREGGE